MTAPDGDWQRLHDEIRAARTAYQPKRARFAREIGVDDSTLQIMEGTRRGNVSAGMLDFVTSKLGWPPGRWREIVGLSSAPAALSDPPTGDEISAARAALGWSLEDLAERIGAGPETIKQWEGGGDIPPRRQQQLRDAFGGVPSPHAGETPRAGDPIHSASDVALLTELLRRASIREQGRAVIG